MDFTDDVPFHPLADGSVIGTHEKPVFYQAAKLRALLVCDADNLMGEKEIYVGGVFHVRGYSDIFHLEYLFECLSFYGGGVGGVFRPVLPRVVICEGEAIPPRLLLRLPVRASRLRYRIASELLVPLFSLLLSLPF